MKVDVLLGLQWGDEGKGKIVDVLAPGYQVVARFQGGPNAGHTLEFDGKKHVLHQVPSGVFRPEVLNIIGNGLVLDPVVFKREADGLTEKFGIDLQKNLLISKKAALILPTHRLLDAAYERAKGEAKIGSTLRGIGPAYTDKVSRQGMRVGDVLLPSFEEEYNRLVGEHRRILGFYQYEYDLSEAEALFFEAIDFLKTFRLVDTEYVVNDALAEGRSILAEGAQGSLLDLDFGSYPFVTSSSTMSAGVCTGLGIAPCHVGEVYGIFKAYCTRVGAGPFPTELHDEQGEAIRRAGNEFGSTTGRPRRTGWLDLPSLRYAILLNGVTQLVMMKVDVLNQEPEVKVCTHYRLPDGSVTDRLPYDLTETPVEPVYRVFPGWKADLAGLKTYDEMPQPLADFVDFLEKELQLPIRFISTSPDREAIIHRQTLDALA